MTSLKYIILFCCFNYTFTFGFAYSDGDKPCAPHAVRGQSILCVCNSSYCDTITRVQPPSGSFVSYTSSEAGKRFHKSFGQIYEYAKISPNSIPTFKLNPKRLHQVISGFGGAVTDSAAINWKMLKNKRLRQYFVDSYFSVTGLEYSMMRLPIGGTDFSTRPYTYQDSPEDDPLLSSFALAPEDIEYKIPLIRECMKVATTPIRIVSSLWSPPIWMKTIHRFDSGFLKNEYYQTLALYFLKFLEQYAAKGIPVWGITTTNEPLNAIMFNLPLNKLSWTAYAMSNWITNNLGPTIRNSKFQNIKIIGVDDQRFTIPLWFNILNETAISFLDGIGVHFYTDKLSPPSQLTQALEDYPDKFILYTEASEGANDDDGYGHRVVLGSWGRGESYATNIIENLNYQVIGWLDWNICLNVTGGPTYLGSALDSPIIMSPSYLEFYKQPMFYVMGHFSKFIPRGSKRIEVTKCGRVTVEGLSHVAFLTPKGTVLMVFYNKFRQTEVAVKLNSQYMIVNLDERSITTIEFAYQGLP